MKGSVVVSGLGITAPNGLGVKEFWAATLRGESGIRPISSFAADAFPSGLAGEIRGFVPRERIPGRLVPQTDRMTQLALVAGEHALADAEVDLDELPALEAGVVTAATSGGFDFGQRELGKLWSKGPEHVSAYMSFAWFYAVNSGQLAIRQGLRGPSGVVVSDHAGGLDALGQARRQVRRGIRLMVCGGMDSSLCPYGLAAHHASGRLSPRTDPRRAYRPFGTDASGYVPGEGGAMLIVESAEQAVARLPGSFLAELAGYGATFDPPEGSGREPGLRRAAEIALADAGVTPGEVDVVFADAAGWAPADRSEAKALRELFGPRGVPVTAPKTMTGRLGSGGGVLDVATAMLAIRDNVIPPTVNVGEPVEEDHLDLVLDTPRKAAVRVALVLARGRPGFNAAIVVREQSFG
ncbi:ketosynthase chain-length factor [Nonomuraea sp. NPDC049158]|uniref:ketosynthase chain-length factor n=1 Tax=Nonomuraea sp. NPDC049158 TaxID=3155649 RepID=UPI0034047FEF